VSAALTEPAADAAITAACASLHLPAVRAEAGPLADAAARERLTHRAFLAEVLATEVDARDARRQERRRKEARFPRLKTLAGFDLAAAPGVDAATIAAFAAGGWIDRGEPVVLLGDSGTGKTHLLIGLGVAACEQGRSVRYVTAAKLVNELVEAADERTLSRAVARYARVDLLCCDLCRVRNYADTREAGIRAARWRWASRRGGGRGGRHSYNPSRKASRESAGR